MASSSSLSSFGSIGFYQDSFGSVGSNSSVSENGMEDYTILTFQVVMRKHLMRWIGRT